MSIILRADIPGLENHVQESIDLAPEYWSPEGEGEKKRMYYMGIQPHVVPDQKNKEQNVELSCAVFVEIVADVPRTVINGSVRLVSIVSALQAQTPVEVTYRGKKKNRTNGNSSAQWSVVTLKAPEKGGKNGKS